MTSPHCVPRMRHITLVAAAFCFALGSAYAQSTLSPAASDSTGIASTESSSSQMLLVSGDDSGGSAALPADPAAGNSGAGQYQDTSSHGGLVSHLTFEGGCGFNGPLGGSSNYITWGANFGFGGGYRVNDRLSLMMDYQFIDDKLPGKLIAETGATGGNAHIWSLTLNPILDIFPKNTNDLYVTGGGGFYRKVTNFTDPQQTQYCSYFYCQTGVANQVVGHFSSNQGGFSIGGGYQRRMGGMYGDSKLKLFAEVRFLDVLSPASAIAPNGLGTAIVGSGTKLIPVTLGLRW